MASLRSRAPVGSTDWINDENTQLSQFKAQELEDFTFATRNEVEWLNEHMADIFTKSQVDVTEIFKTPGKLRGKTPRTARKRNPLEVRQPLTDVFSTNARQAPQTSPQKERKQQPTEECQKIPPIVQSAPIKPTKTNTDSGYHGMSDDETDPEEDNGVAKNSPEEQLRNRSEMVVEQPMVATVDNTSESTGRATTTEGSFHSARERSVQTEDAMPISEPAVPLIDTQDQHPQSNIPPPRSSPQRPETENKDEMDIDQQDDDLALDEPIDESQSPSQGSSPFEPLLRKSSLTFAALPAPEPWTTKKSMGARVSRTSHLEQTRNTLSRGSYLGRITGGKSLGASKQVEQDHEWDDNLHNHDMEVDGDGDGLSRPAVAREESEGDAKMTRLHNKSSTQRLHEKINMLGKSQPARPTKSIAANTVMSNPPYPELPMVDLQTRAPEQVFPEGFKSGTVPVPEDDDDDWIQPPPSQSDQSKRPQLPKSTTADVMESIRGKQHIGDSDFAPGLYDGAAFKDSSAPRQPVLETNAISPNLARSASAAVLVSPQRGCEAAQTNTQTSKRISNHHEQPISTTTPAETPSSKRNVDGPISASKSKLQSIMKTARGLFTSSAGVSAQAKIEALSSPTTRSRGKAQENAARNSKLNEEMYHGLDGVPSNIAKQPEGRKTRSSTEKEERRKQQEARTQEQEQQYQSAEHMEDTHKVELDRQSIQSAKVIRQSPRRLQKQPEPKQQTEESETLSSIDQGMASGQAMAPPQAQPSQLQKPKELRRPVKPAREAASKPKPQTILVGAPSKHRMPISNSAISSSLQESLPPAQASRPGLVKKASNASIQTSGSHSSLKGSVSSKPKALIAAERKKEQDEKEAQRKLDQKKEIERKRAAQQEEARQQERLHREEAERQRERERSAAAEDSKKAGSRQLIEKRRLELAKKEQQQRALQRPNQDAAMPQNAPPAHRPELGGARPPSRLHTVQDYSRPALNHPPPNPARPPLKRAFDPEPEDEPPKPMRVPAGQTYQANEDKRRRTGEDEPRETNDLHKQSIFNNYSTAPPPASHHTSTLLKTSTTNQTYQQHASHQQGIRLGQQAHDMAKYGTARPPFADARNPPAPAHKTPLPKHLAPPPKASPQFVNGENIHLDDIPTDSDSDDSPDPAKRTMLPDWVQSPELRRLIEEQEKNQNADSIFGPPQTPRMEEMFKDRHQRFRNRTSSANWTASGDRLTEAEKVADQEARERVRREGGWTFGL